MSDTPVPNYFMVKCIGGFGDDFEELRNRELKEDQDAYGSTMRLYRGEIEKLLTFIEMFFSRGDNGLVITVYNPQKSLSTRYRTVNSIWEFTSEIWKLSAEMGPEGFYFTVLCKVPGERPYTVGPLSKSNMDSFLRFSPDCFATEALGEYLQDADFFGITADAAKLKGTRWGPEGVYTTTAGGTQVVMCPRSPAGRTFALPFSLQDLSRCFESDRFPGTPLQVVVPHRKLVFVWDFADPFIGWRVIENYERKPDA